MTKLDAVHKWVNEFNCIPTSVAAKLMNADENDIREVTPFDEDEEPYDVLPMWGYMWQMDDGSDADWLEDNLEAVHKCGFRIYESEDFGFLIGIDGAGYDFYEAHWTPLYEARGLHFHDEEERG